ncbi:S41 family peptidase [Spirosoma soli]|uniref:S41 family peptidase n=1 Tax=Spirosoma soli TaxID=1770529 RepID=A0ABW5M8X4_9BACT
MSNRQTITLFLLLTTGTLWAQTNYPSTLTDAQKIAGLSKFWSEASYNFAYFDKARINWDSAYQAYVPQVLTTKNDYDYYRTLERFCALLKDGHTNVNAPWSLLKYSTYVPFRWTIIDKKPYVSRVLKGLSDAVPVGSELITVNGQPVREYLESQVFPYISASTEHQKWNNAMFGFWSANRDTTAIIPMTFRAPNGQVITYKSRLFSQRERDGSQWLQGNGSVPPAVKLSTLTILPGDIAHVELTSFGNDKIIDEFKAMVPQLRTAKGVILDIRQNGGGNSGTGAEILKYFTEEKRLVGSRWRTREHRAAFKAWGSWQAKEPYDSVKAKKDDWYRRSYQTFKGDFWYTGDTMTFANDITEPKLLMPVVVLAGNYTASAAEDLLIMIRQLKSRQIPILGEPSMGTTGQPLPFDLPGGGTARICTKRDTYADGRDFVGIGVLPDVEIKPTVADLISGKDIVLEKAVAYLQPKSIAKSKK